MTDRENEREFRRRQVLRSFGALEAEQAELLAYTSRQFETDISPQTLAFPLPSEPFADAWRGYIAEAQTSSPIEVLRRVLPQFRFPVAEGLSEHAAYRAATRQGLPADPEVATGLPLIAPSEIEIQLYPTAAGEVPVIIVRQRQDFVAIVRALTMRNEPKPVPDSMGASMIAGYNNWDRIRAYREQWTKQTGKTEEHEWQSEFRQLTARKELYQDRFIVLSNGPYSNVAATSLDLPDAEWREKSLVIRRDHECAHYFTRRVLGSMQNNLLDEIIADYMGIVAAAGSYQPNWFLHFMGLEKFPEYRRGGRLENYCGETPFSSGAFNVLTKLVVAAAQNLAQFDRQLLPADRTLAGSAAVIMTLASFQLEELAADDSPALLASRLAAYRQ